MINIDAGNMQKRTYYSMLRKLTELESEELNNLRKAVIKKVTDAVIKGEWSVELRCDNSAFAEIILTELRMKGFTAHAPISYRNSMAKSDPYYELQIDWQLGD